MGVSVGGLDPCLWGLGVVSVGPGCGVCGAWMGCLWDLDVLAGRGVKKTSFFLELSSSHCPFHLGQ